MLTWGELHKESMLALINSTYSNQPPMPVPHSSQSMFMICCVSSPHSSQSQAQSQEDGAGLQLHPSGSRPSLFFSSKMVGPEHTTPIGATSSVLANPVRPEHATSVGSFDFDFFPSGWSIPTPTSNPCLLECSSCLQCPLPHLLITASILQLLQSNSSLLFLLDLSCIPG